MERVELDEPSQEGSAWDDICPPSLDTFRLGMGLAAYGRYIHFSLAFSPRSQGPSSLRVRNVTAHVFLLWLILGVCK